MTLLTWLILAAAAIAAVLAGRLDIALLLAGAKTLLVGLEFMELRHAARLHATVFVLATAMLTVVLFAATR